MAEADDVAARIAALAVVAKMVAEADTRERARLLELIRPGARVPAEIAGPDGTLQAIGAVTLSEGKSTRVYEVDDEEAFTAWVEAAHPTEFTAVDRVVGTAAQVVAALRRAAPELLETRREVRQAFRRTVLHDVQYAEWMWVDPTTGEVLDTLPPGVVYKVQSTAPRLMCKTKADAPAIVAAGWKAQRLGIELRA